MVTQLQFLCKWYFVNSTVVYLTIVEKDISYLDPLQSGGGLCHTLRHVEAFGGADFGIDQPLLEVSQSGAEPLLQQAFLILTFPGCPEAETSRRERC